MSEDIFKKYERLHLAGLIIGLVSAGYLMLGGIRNLVISYWSASFVPFAVCIQLAGAVVVFFIVAFAWRKPFICGMALVVVWLMWNLFSVLTSLDGIRMIFEHGLWLAWVVSIVFNLMVLVSGILFLLSGRKVQAMAGKTVTETTAGGRRYSRLLLAGLIVGLVAGTMYIQNVSFSFYYLIFLGIGLVIFGSTALAWKVPLAGGILLIIEGLWPLAFWAVSPLLPRSESLGIVMLFGVMLVLSPFYCLPPLASGILFLISWKRGRRVLAGGAPA